MRKPSCVGPVVPAHFPSWCHGRDGTESTQRRVARTSQTRRATAWTRTVRSAPLPT